MANEFVARYGIIAQNNSVISGSLVITNGITGSLSGTSAQSLTSSYVNSLSQSLSITGNLSVTGSSGTVLSSNADTLLITGSLIVTGSASITGSLNVNGGITGSLLGTASYAAQALSASYALTASYTPGSGTATSASYALTASYALNSGGAATIVTGSNATLNQATASATWSFAHNLNTQYPVFQVFDSSNNVIIPQTITALTPSSSVIYFPTAVAGTAVASVGGFTGTATSASYAVTTSFANSFTASNATITGNLGVGITNPSFPLEVSSTSTTLLARFTSNQTNAAIRLVNSSAGLGRTYSIGSGNSGSAAINGFYIYDETGGYTAFAISGSGAVSTGNTIKVGNQGGNDTTVITGGSGYGAKIQLNTATLGTANTVLTGNTDSYINATTGNVGIGTNNPSYQLDVQKGSSPTLRVRNNAAGGTSTLILETANTYSGTSQTYIQCIGTAGNGTSQLVFATGNSAGSVSATEAMRLTSGGSLGIGVNPSYRLDVSADVCGGFVSQITNVNGSDCAPGSVLILQGGTYSSGDTSSRYLSFRRGDGTEIGAVRRNGSSNVAFDTTSDYRLKEDLKEINGLDKISRIKVYDFQWKDTTDRTDGALAHELQEVVPYAVGGVKDEVDENGKPLYQGVDYSKLVPTLIKAIQEQQATIQELTTRLTALENK